VDVNNPRPAEELWPKLGGVVWDAHDCYALYRLHFAHARRQVGARKPDAAQQNRFAQQLQNVVALRFHHRRWIKSLENAGLEPEDVGQDIVLFLFNRIGRFVLRKPCPLTLVKSLYVAIDNKARDALNGAPRHRAFGRRAEGDERPGRVEHAAADAERKVQLPLRTLLWAESSRDLVLRSGFGDADIDHLIALYVCQRRHLLKFRDLVTHQQLPAWLRERITLEQHALLTFRLHRLVRQRARLAGGAPSEN
jgi:hypothetical protein